MHLLIRLGSIGIGLWQIYAAYKSFNVYKKEGNKSSSVFMIYGIFFGAFVGIIFLVLGVGALAGGL